MSHGRCVHHCGPNSVRWGNDQLPVVVRGSQTTLRKFLVIHFLTYLLRWEALSFFFFGRGVEAESGSSFRSSLLSSLSVSMNFCKTRDRNLIYNAWKDLPFSLGNNFTDFSRTHATFQCPTKPKIHSAVNRFDNLHPSPYKSTADTGA